MKDSNSKIIALIGNPNVGKTSIFNRLTKLNQKVGNYPGITVEKREGHIKWKSQEYKIIDLPGTYSIFPSSADEEIVFDTLLDRANPYRPDLTFVVTEPASIKRGISLYQQIRECGHHAIFVINMVDEAGKKGVEIDYDYLEEYLQTKVILTNARTGQGIDDLKNSLSSTAKLYTGTFEIPTKYSALLSEVKKLFPVEREYNSWLLLGSESNSFLTKSQNEVIERQRTTAQVSAQELQKAESIVRSNEIDRALEKSLIQSQSDNSRITNTLDNYLMHPLIGYVVFLGILLLIFQAIFTWSGPLMDGIDNLFSSIGAYVESVLPEGPLSSLIVNGLIAGIGGIVIFLPQIVILFFSLSIMEESGYMSRVVFLTDRWLRPFGLNGKSVIPLMSGVACAIPAVMSARNIENPKERLLTMLVTPFMACSARLPIYIVIIGLVIPDKSIGIFNLQGLTLFGMYVLGIVGALFSSSILNIFIKSKHKSFLVFEVPTYKIPDWKNVLLNIWEKSSGFLFGAGKIILTISIILWVLGSFGPNDKFSKADEYVSIEQPQLTGEDFSKEVAAYQLEHSYLGYLGMVIEPAVRPLGYDWKMGIGLISSFAAREVFVGTMAVVYSLGDDVDIEDETQKQSLLSRMKSEINRNTGKPAYNFASGISLLLFYAFAMQCMATIAVVKKETGSWKWTLIQLGFMTGLAYIAALIAYQLLK